MNLLWITSEDSKILKTDAFAGLYSYLKEELEGFNFFYG